MKDYAGADFVTPNLAEFETAGGATGSESALVESAQKIIVDCQIGTMLLTRSEQGMSLITASEKHDFPTQALEVSDVTGAGDTVIATFALNDLCGLNPLDSAMIANLAAGRVCEDVGVCPITVDSLIDFFSHHYKLEK